MTPRLTRRERDVLLLIAKGMTNKAIARELGLSPNTIKRHAVRLYNRTGVGSRIEAALWYWKEWRMTFDEAFDRLIGHEGGYANHPSDPGGETMWGVTARVARANGYQGDMRALPREKAKQIYLAKYWEPVRGYELPETLRFDVFDAAVNSGTAQAIEWLQEAVGAKVDGVIGPATLAAARSADALAPARFNGIRLKFMTDLPTWAHFGKGWARRVASNLATLKD